MTTQLHGMTISKAIERARKLVKVIHYGTNDFVVQEWVPRYSAFTESSHMDHHRAQSCAKEAKIRAAFEAMGGSYPDDYPYHLHQEYGRWDELLRDYAKKTS